MTNAHRGPKIPLAPLTAWCHEQVEIAARRRAHLDPSRTNRLYGPTAELADRLGIQVRVLNRLMRGVYAGCQDGHKGEFPTDTIARYYVEDLLVRAGVDFYDLYPELEGERDIKLEPDAWCRCCREFVTPIFGCCPWDDTPVHMEMAA